MEGLTLRAYVLGGLLVAGGFLVYSSPAQAHTPRTESWMEDKAPARVGDFTMQPSAENPKQSYKMSQTVYEALTPSGIVCRRFQNGDENYDVVLIASRNKASFHDPRVCFSAQSYVFKNETTETLQTSRGTIPVTVADMTGQEDALAVFFYRGPRGFYPTTLSFKVGLLWSQLTSDADPEGVFYRFMALGPHQDKAKFLSFISKYLDEAQKTSGGYF